MVEQLYQARSSSIHRLDLWTKALCLLVFLPVGTFIAEPLSLVPMGIYLFCLILASRIGINVFWKQTRIYLFALAVAMISLSIAFSPGDLWSRLASGALITGRFTVLVCSGILFALTTDPIELPIGLLRVGIPHRYGVSLMVAFRMMPLISKKVYSVVEAQKARAGAISVSLSGIPMATSRVFSLAVPIVYSTLEASVALSDTLISRGYNPVGPFTVPPTRLRVQDVVFVLLSLIAVAPAIVWRLR